MGLDSDNGSEFINRSLVDYCRRYGRQGAGRIVRRLVATVATLGLLAGPAAVARPDWASLGLTAYAPPIRSPEFSLPDLTGRTRTLAETW